MNYIYKIIDYLIVTEVYVLFIFAFIIFLLIELLKIDLTEVSYKITSWKYTTFFCFFYIIFFFIFILIFRIIRNPINMNMFYTQLLSYITTIKALTPFYQILQIFIIILLLIFWIFLFIKIYKICCNEWIKIHFYVYFKYMEKYQEFLDIITAKFTINIVSGQLYMKYILPIILYFYKKYPYNFINNMGKNIARFTQNMFLYLHYIVLFFTLFYDILYNNSVLLITTKYLPIFMLFTLWKKLSNFFEDQNPSFNKVLVEQYYGTPNIIYVNVTEDYIKILNNYVKTLKTKIFNIDDYTFTAPIITLHRFVLIDEQYYNEHINLGFNKSDLIIKEGKYFVKHANLYAIIQTFNLEE